MPLLLGVPTPFHCGALGPDASCRGVQWDVTPGHSIPRGALLGNWPSWTALWSLAGLFPRHKPFLGTAPAPCSSSHPWRGLCGHTASPHRSDQGCLRWIAIRFFWEIWRWEPELVSPLWEAELAPCHHKAELVRQEQEPGEPGKPNCREHDGVQKGRPWGPRWRAEGQSARELSFLPLSRLEWISLCSRKSLE